MLGPLKIIGPFAKMTAGWDRGLKRQLAFRAIVIAAVGALIAVTIGTRVLRNWGVSLGALLMTVGIVLFLVALDVVMREHSHERPENDGAFPANSSRSSPAALAFAPVAFPTILTPYGIAVLILLVSLRAGQTIFVLEIIGLAALVPVYTPANAPSGAVGSGGVEAWSFQASQSGRQELRFEYRRPWERDVAAARALHYTIAVR